MGLLDSATDMVVPTPLAWGPSPPPSMALPALLTLVPTPLATAMASVPLMPRLRLMAPTDTLVLLDSATDMGVPTPVSTALPALPTPLATMDTLEPTVSTNLLKLVFQSSLCVIDQMHWR